MRNYVQKCKNCKYYIPVSYVMCKCWKNGSGRIPKTITGMKEINYDNRKCKDFEVNPILLNK
ncbi:MAG: hypothetical protein P8Y70_18045 [Candidatus Lokiarchaeota archaeon]